MTTEQEATEVLLEAQRKKIQAFDEAYKELCDKYGCQKVASAGLTEDGRIGTSLRTGIRQG